MAALNVNSEKADSTGSNAALRTAEAVNGAPTPRITVITPAYNVARFIGEAIDSALRQTFPDFEYLIVDDGSTDQTAEVVRRHSRGDERVRLIMAEHAGAAAARNAGLDAARGEFLAFLDGDDRWHPDFLQRQLELLESLGTEVAAVFARSRVVSENGRRYAFRWQRSGRYDLDDMLVQVCPPRCGSSLLIRKRCFDLVGGFTGGKVHEDLTMWLRIQKSSGMPYFWGSSAYLLDLRVRAGAISRDHRRAFEASDAIAREFAPAMRRHPEGMAYLRIAVFAFRAGCDDFALPWARRARQSGLLRLLAQPYGWRLLGWSALPPAGRRALRRASTLARGVLGAVIKAPGGVLR
jgi:glycosyltransferase involved in cell wall biosynthesis